MRPRSSFRYIQIAPTGATGSVALPARSSLGPVRPNALSEPKRNCVARRGAAPFAPDGTRLRHRASIVRPVALAATGISPHTVSGRALITAGSITVGSPSMTTSGPVKVEHPVIAALYDACMWPQELFGFRRQRQTDG